MLCMPSSFCEEILTASILPFHFLKVFVCWQISDWFQAAWESYFTGWLELLWNMTFSQLTPLSCGTGAGHAARERDRQQVSFPPLFSSPQDHVLMCGVLLQQRQQKLTSAQHAAVMFSSSMRLDWPDTGWLVDWRGHGDSPHMSKSYYSPFRYSTHLTCHSTGA